LAVAVLLGLANPVLAQQEAGNDELQLQGNLSLGSGSHKTSGQIMVNPGRFFTALQEIGIHLNSTITNGKLMGSVAPSYRFNFSTNKVVSYLGISAGTQFGNAVGGRSAMASAEAGLRYFVARKTAFTLSTGKSYLFKQKKFDPGLDIDFGFTHLWGK
jgi:hypothetical protein